MASYTKLEGADTDNGTFVLAGQEMATSDGYRNVSLKWFETTKSIGDVRDEIASTADCRHSAEVSVGELNPVVVDGRFAVEDRRGEAYFPDKHSAGQLGKILGIGSEFPKEMVTQRDPGAAKALAVAVSHSIQFVEVSKRLRFRFEGHGELRGIAHAESEYLRNDVYLSILERAVPGGRISHWRGDDYTSYGNLLIPDTIREESDSEYGAMVSLSNCEIGKRGTSVRPSLFRAICMNGCIWDRSNGAMWRMNRRAMMTTDEIERAIIQNVREQIPLAVAGLDQLLATRGVTTDVSMKPVVAEIAIEQKLTKAQTTAVLNAWFVERKATPELSQSLFAVVNAITRAGQREPNDTWVRFDELGGRLAQIERDGWDGLVTRASRLSAKKVDARFVAWSLAG